MTAIVRYLIARSRLSNLLLIFIFLLSLGAAGQIQRMTFPRVDLEKMNITTFYPGASPEDVELNVTTPLEDALSGVDGLDRYESRSMEGQSRIEVYIDADAGNSGEIKQEIRRAIDSVTDLPPEIRERPAVFDVKVDNFTVFEVALLLPEPKESGNKNGATGGPLRLEDRRLLYQNARRLKRRLKNLPTVGKVREFGLPEREIQILVNAARLRALSVGLDEVTGAIEKGKVRLGAGNLESFQSERGILTISDFERPRDVERLVVRAGDLGYRIRVGDLARVEDGFAHASEIIRYNGRPGVSLKITKKGSADIIHCVDEIRAGIKKFEEELKSTGPGTGEPPVRLLTVRDESLYTRQRLSLVYSNAVVGFFLVLAVLFVFLRWRLAFWTALGIPVSVAITIIFLPVFGVTVNSISLLGFVVVLGMVVDDAIIVSESIFRAIERGEPPRQAAITGFEAVIKPVIATIITTIIAFLPMYFIPGIIGDFSLEIPTVVILVLTASLAEAIFILPVHLAHSRLGSEDAVTGAPPAREAPGQKLFAVLEYMYGGFLRRLLRRPALSFGILTGALVAGGALSYQFTSFKMFPEEQSSLMYIYGETEAGSSLEFTGRQTKILEEHIRSLPPGVVLSTVTVAGRDLDDHVLSAHKFYTVLSLSPPSERSLTAPRIRDILKKKLAGDHGELSAWKFMIQTGGPRAGKDLEVRVNGNDNKGRRLALERVREWLGDLPVTDIDSNLKAGKENLRVIPLAGRVADSFTSPAAVATVLRTAFDGSIVAWRQTPEEKIPYRVRLDEPSRDYNRPLKNLTVRNSVGKLVPVENLVRLESSLTRQNIYHYNGQRVNTITAALDEKKGATPLKVYDHLRKKLNSGEKLPPGITVELGGEARENAKTFRHMLIAIITALVAIFFILVIQFDSWTQPVMVILAVPFGLVGIGLAFALHGMDLSLLAMIGILGFSGVVINDSLIMVDFMNKLAREDPGESREALRERVTQGALYRLRPIFLTTLTTVLGLLPTAYGWVGGFDHFISPMVMAMAWGLLTGTLSVLLVIPLQYYLNWRLVELAGDMKKRLGR